MTYFFLIIAIVTEVAATLLLKASEGWEKWWLGVASIGLFVIAGVCLSVVLKTMNVGLIYTVWSGVGIALICIASVFLWQQKFDVYAISGIGLIFVGTLLIATKSGVVIQ